MLKEQQTQQKAYIELLAERAKQEALARLADPSTGPLLFDPQGRVLINVSLTTEELAQFDNLGHTPTPVTTVSLDVLGNPSPDFDGLKEEYREQYNLAQNGLTDDDQIKEKQEQALMGIRGSIIPLQQEYHFHLALTARSYAAAGRFTEAQMSQAHEAAMVRVQELITQAVKDSLAKATKKGEVDDVKLVQALDKARKNISTEAHRILVEEITRATGVILTKKEIKDLHLKHTAEITTATPNDVVHIDHDMGQTTLIAGSQVTAHDRGIGAQHLADRRLITIAHDDANQGPPRIQIRVPSLDVKEKIKPKDAIADVEVKLNHIRDKYQIGEQVDDGPTGIKAFTYNLHTALNDSFEGGKNKQSQGAQYILSGAHNYNAAQLDKEPPVFCLVQNISVNGFGDSLGYGWNKLRNEATLMTEMSMMYNLVAKDDPQRARVEDAFKAYKAYLSDDNRPAYFSQSPQAEEARKAIKDVKAGWAKTAGRGVVDEQLSTAEQTVESAKIALKAMMANNLHHSHEHAKLFQSMSMFVEQASIAGCKSGNERAQAINGRVAVLDSVASQQNDPIVQAINAVAQAKTSKEVTKATANLKQALDSKYDNHLQSGPSIISAVDQGAAAKVNAKRGLAGLFNRNYAEESTLEHLQQGKAGKMQAHKNLTKESTDAWEGPQPKGYFAFAREKWGGVLGTIGALLGFAAPSYFQHKSEVNAQHQAFMDRLHIAQEDYQKAQLVKEAKVAKIVNDTHVEREVVDAELNSKQKVVAEGEKEVLEDAPEPVQWRKGGVRATDGNLLPSRAQLVQVHSADFREALDDIRKIGDRREKQEQQEEVIARPGL
ncbi:hypothetical protein [Legionella saoudiensis]|uniref:hypothetical protein n=1 Tax=Legionella saoudiensis TaxID=1750561 RepID=UPI0007304C30|nr:hypothetical protein [Legionella saoudiensis]